MEDFKKYYEFPLESDKYDSNVVYTHDFERAFDFTLIQPILYGDFFREEKLKREVIDAINGKDNGLVLEGLKYDQQAQIFLNGRLFIQIRGWGNLTGIGALNLPDDVAKRIQDDFANYILLRLAKK